MAKVRYLVRRNNIYYFRYTIPKEYRQIFNKREVIKSLKTELKSEAVPRAMKLAFEVSNIIREQESGSVEFEAIELFNPTTALKGITNSKSKVPKLSAVVADFLDRYDKSAKTMLTKLTSTLPIFVELMGDKKVNQILQADINAFFDDIQKLPVRSDAAKFKGKSFKEIIKSNNGHCIAEKTFKSTYRACVSVFLGWALVNYGDQGFPSLTVKSAVYRGNRKIGINKQRAMTNRELRQLFGHELMKTYAKNPLTVHYCWLPLVGLFTGARINEICQLNPFTDIVQDKDTGIVYFWFNDETETAKDVKKSIKTKSSKRVVPIHSELLKLGFLDYMEKVKTDGEKLLFPEFKVRDSSPSFYAGRWFIRYLSKVGLRDETEGAYLTGFHSFRHTFITHAINHKISGFEQITGHEVDNIDGIGKVSNVVKGYYTTALTDNLKEKQAIVERFNFDIKIYKPSIVFDRNLYNQGTNL